MRPHDMICYDTIRYYHIIITIASYYCYYCYYYYYCYCYYHYYYYHYYYYYRQSPDRAGPVELVQVVPAAAPVRDEVQPAGRRPGRLRHRLRVAARHHRPRPHRPCSPAVCVCVCVCVCKLRLSSSPPFLLALPSLHPSISLPPCPPSFLPSPPFLLFTAHFALPPSLLPHSTCYTDIYIYTRVQYIHIHMYARIIQI